MQSIAPMMVLEKGILHHWWSNPSSFQQAKKAAAIESFVTIGDCSGTNFRLLGFYRRG
jgi:hypothetical protein